jgi:hypothetical protein
MSLIATNDFAQQFGGLYTAVRPYNKFDPIHRGMFGGILRDTIDYEAKVHGAAFDREGFRKVMQALASNEIEASFFMAAWDICDPAVVYPIAAY